jgi:hypothetical protein
MHVTTLFYFHYSSTNRVNMIQIYPPSHIDIARLEPTRKRLGLSSGEEYLLPPRPVCFVFALIPKSNLL